MIKRLILLCIFASGCSLYWGGGGEDDYHCVYNGTDTPASPGLRDPQTGVCNYNYGGGGYCDGSCGPCPAYAAPSLSPDWGQCNTYCDALDESSCIATTGCHAAYIDTGDSLASPKFYGCWETAPTGADPNSPCANLDAQTCSERDNCSMVYTGSPSDLNTTTKFEQCVNESAGSCNSGQQCPMGSHCEQQCAPCNSVGCSGVCPATCVSDTTCDTTTCGLGSQCVEQCDASGCAPTCVPTGTDPGSCTGTITCNNAPPTCPANTTPGIANGCWSGYCIPNADCGTHDPGQCYAQVLCNSAPPSCPSGTLPGVTNGCWSGYCIPTYGCELPACEALGSENACTARTDCTPVYTGTDCTCTLAGCTCATETYARCESLVMPL